MIDGGEVPRSLRFPDTPSRTEVPRLSIHVPTGERRVWEQCPALPDDGGDYGTRTRLQGGQNSRCLADSPQA